MPTKRKEVAQETTLKKAKKDPLKEQFREIVSSWDKAPVPEDVKRMLEDILPCALGVFSDERHSFQERVVASVAAVMGDAEAAFNGEIKTSRAQHNQASADKPLQEKEVAEATVSLESAKGEAQRLKVLLAEAATTFRAKTAALSEAEDARALDAQKAVEASKRKADYETALQDLVFLKTISAEEADGAARQKQLATLLKKYKFEESMLIALPAAVAKAPEARGQFDIMAITQLENEINKSISEEESVLAAAKPGQDKCDAAVKSAEDSLAAARAQQRTVAKQFDVASKHQMTCEESLAAAQKALKSLTSSIKRLESSVYNAEAELELFQQGPMETFKTLQNRATPVPVVQDGAVEVPEAEERPVEAQSMEVQERVAPIVAAC